MKTCNLQLLILLVSLLSGMGSCFGPDPLNQELKSIQPVNISYGLNLSSPTAEKVDSAALADIFNVFSI